MNYRIQLVASFFIFLPCVALAAVPPPPSKLVATDGSNSNEFGYSVDIFGNTSIMGARNTGPGSAYIFQRPSSSSTDWIQTSKIVPSDGVAFDEFGASVSLSGNVAIVGSAQHGAGGSHTGSAYIYLHTGNNQQWSEVARLHATDLQQNAFFGNSVVVHGNTAVVGAYKADGNAGAVYVFQSVTGDGSNWTRVAKIPAPAGAAGFGAKVDFDGNSLLIGASTSASDFGSAYLYRQGIDPNQWSLLATLPQSDPGFGDEYGDAVALAGHIAVVAASRNLGSGNHSGTIYIFDQNAGGPDHWGLVQRFAPSDISANAEFGWAIGIDQQTIAVGARADNAHGASSGSTREGRRICALPKVRKQMDEFEKRFREAKNQQDPQLLSEAYTAVADAFTNVGDQQEAEKWRQKAADQAAKAKAQSATKL